MRFFIQILPDKTAQLVSEQGRPIMSFATLDQARLTCKDWYCLPEVVIESAPHGDNRTASPPLQPFLGLTTASVMAHRSAA